MIEDGFTYLAALLLIAGLIRYLEEREHTRFFKAVPGAVVLYLLVMIASSLGLWQKSESVNTAYSEVKNNILPAMIFLMLLKCDMRQIVMLGPRMLGAFAASVISIIAGFVVMFLLLGSWFPEGSWKALAALAGSWMGGSGNMVAVQSALDVPDSMMGYALLVDSIDYALWVVFLLGMVPYAAVFNRWTGANTNALDQLSAQLQASDIDKEAPFRPGSASILLGLALVVSAGSQILGGMMPSMEFFSSTTWTILVATILGIVAALTRLSKLGGSSDLANIMLYAIIALIASRADFAELLQAPLFIAAGFIVLAVHGGVMALTARIFSLDLFSCGLASLANIGGVASAPILAATYNRGLIPIGVLMALLGYVVGTFGGLLVGRLLLLIGG